MNIRMGSQLFANVEIPVLWGERAVLQDKTGKLSVVDLSGETARPEIIADEPAPDIEFRPRVDGIVILDGSRELYSYDPIARLLSSVSLGLQDIQITGNAILIGTNRFTNNFISGHGVGIVVSMTGIGIGAPFPIGLAKLVV